MQLHSDEPNMIFLSWKYKTSAIDVDGFEFMSDDMTIPPQQAVCNMVNALDTECFIRMEDLRLAPFSLRNGDTLSGRVVAYNYFGYSEPSNTASVKLQFY